jgi:hypothetical protein
MLYRFLHLKDDVECDRIDHVLDDDAQDRVGRRGPRDVVELAAGDDERRISGQRLRGLVQGCQIFSVHTTYQNGKKYTK